MLKIDIKQKGSGFFKKEILYDIDRSRTIIVSLFGLPIYRRSYEYTMNLDSEEKNVLGFTKKD